MAFIVFEEEAFNYLDAQLENFGTTERCLTRKSATRLTTSQRT